MNGYSGLRSVTDGSNIDPNKKTTKIIVDPHELDSFTIDISAMKGAGNPYAVKQDKQAELRALNGTDRSTLISNNLRKLSRDVTKEAPPNLGTVSATIDGGNHVNPAATLPTSAVTPPLVRVYFDMPGLATLNSKYHGVTVVPGYLVLTTDLRYAGSGEFYPFTSKLANESSAYIGVMVEGVDSLFLIRPPAITHKFGPYEHCLVPISQEKELPEEIKKNVDKDKEVETSPQTEYDTKADYEEYDRTSSDDIGVL
jgi:hypothetical protein